MMSEFKRGDNLRFIANYLYANPGSRYTDILRALCEFRGKEYNRGMYCEYFRSSGPKWLRLGYGTTHWKKEAGVWWLRPKGMVHVDLR
tara:strand:- start:815 stop:1078 length:264 start_codon:yes stop_codon:yes gene_type:complete